MLVLVLLQVPRGLEAAGSLSLRRTPEADTVQGDGKF